MSRVLLASVLFFLIPNLSFTAPSCDQFMDINLSYDGKKVYAKVTNNNSSRKIKIDRVLVTVEGVNFSDTYPENFIINSKTSRTITRLVDKQENKGAKEIFINCSYVGTKIEDFGLKIFYVIGFFILLILGGRYMSKNRKLDPKQPTLRNYKTLGEEIIEPKKEDKIQNEVLKEFSYFYRDYKILDFSQPKKISLEDYEFNKKLLFDCFRILSKITEDWDDMASTQITFGVVTDNFVSIERYTEVQLNLKEWQKRCIGYEEFEPLGKLLRFATGFNYEDLEKESI